MIKRVGGENKMIAVYASCYVSDENRSKFIELAEKLIVETRKEAGNISYELIEAIEEKGLFAFLERWPDKEALDIHMKSEHFTTLIPKISELLKDEMKITSHEVII